MKKLTVIAALLAGCASMNDSLTPSLRVEKDSFDGAVVARQPSVGASAEFAEARHMLAFDWNQRTPDIVYVTAGALGARAITGLAFNADGKMIDNLKEASYVTDRDVTRYGTTAERRFAMAWPDFLALVNARSVKMRVSRINDYTVSSFGPDHGGAIVNTKLLPFAEKVRELRAAVGRQ